MQVKFGTDGARAPFSNDLTAESGLITPESGFRIGAAAVEALGINRFVMVQDTRTFNPELAAAIKEGIASRGGVTADLGILPTPAAAFVADHLTTNTEREYGAFSITASHNKATDAGIKVFGKGGNKLDDEVTGNLQHIANTLSLPGTGSHTFDQSGRLFNNDALRQLYIEIALKSVSRDVGRDFLRGKDIVVDAANGAAFWSAPEILRRLGANVTLINGDPLAEINKDCGATHTGPMQQIVRDTGAHYGGALDGDADRLEAFQIANGFERVLDGEDALVIEHRYQKELGLLVDNAEVITTDYATTGFEREMRRRGVKTIFVGNGDRYVHERLNNSKSAFAGAEKSGHILLKRVAKAQKMILSGDGTIAMVQQLQAEVVLGKRLTQVSSFDRLGYARADIVVALGTNAIAVVAHECVSRVISAGQDMVGPDGMVMVRGSGTEPIIRVLAKTGEDQSLVDAIVEELEVAVQEVTNG